ncbi:TBC1 domain family member 2A isoform X1 [Mesocricetus auratus]|uniref:TBC1 domain family member 2A isoform X1 n=1 Tax=Mesocricetus auratus TaxID=10036 RepID=A0ABM2WV86_MESAU|nr:TBC1 domain family member 2A isoform X1 [Mesocricetus auratus]
MENAPECTPSPSEFTQPPSSAREPEVASPGDPEGCARPLDTVPKKLCGYLSKFGGKGPIKGWKCRWFFYDEGKCHLYYSRTAQDANPLDSIDLSSAVFDCKANAEDEGTFEVKTPNRVITLKAATKQAMLYWLQQLQMKRWEFHNSPPALPVTPAAGLPGNGPALHLKLEQEAELEEFLCPVKTPTGLVGAAAALQPVPAMPSTLQNISLKHLGTEIQNTVHYIRGNKQTQAPGHGPLVAEPSQGVEPQSGEQRLTSDPSTPAGKEPEESPKPALRSSLSSSPMQKPKRQSNTFPFFSDGLARSRMTQEKVAALEQQVLILTEELKSQKELVIILHKALEAAQQEKRASSAYLAAPEDKDRLELVRHKVRQIAELSQRVEALEQDRERLAHESGLLQQQVQLLMDKNQAKQQVICKLSQKLTEDLAQPDQPASAANGDFLSQQERMEHLKDDMEAYRTQNRFLNSEIHQVTKIWRKVAEKEKALLTKCAYLQARNCQVESKYLAGLRRLQEAAGAEAGDFPGLLRQLVHEALQWEAGEAPASVELRPVSSEYDAYGFLTVPDYEVEDLKLLAKIQALEVCSHHLLGLETVQRPLRERWAALTELAPTAELKQLLRAGVPREHRPRVWRWLVHRRVQHLHSPGCYQELLARGQTRQHPAARQIELDLNRTFPTNKHFTCPASSFPDKLRRVLLAFSWQNPTIGYCQGLNRLAAIALLVLEDEESAFWCLVAIVETILPAEYYSKTLTASQVDQRVLRDLLSEKLPRLTAHLRQHHTDLSLITFNWFLVVFADSLISDILLQVWDAFLYEGTKVVFRYALAIFKYNEEEILRLQDSLEIYQYLRFFTKTICDSRKLMSIAFDDMNPFPMKQLRQLRAVHRERLEAELRELELLKAEYLERRASRGRAVPESCVSEDEGEGDG